LSVLAAREKWLTPLVTGVELQPLSAVHFTPGTSDGAIRTSQLSTLYALLSIALFILALAIVNYVNLATAQSLTREKEISIRKVMGSGRGNLIAQLLVETFLLTTLAGLGAVTMVRPVLGAFHRFVPPALRYEPFALTNLLFLMGITVVTTLLAGLYPARLLSAHSPVDTLKGAGAPKGGGKWWLRKGLIVFQFTVSLLFIIATMVIGRQIGYMLHKDLGFKSDAIVDFNTNEHRDSAGMVRVKLLEAAVGRLPGVAAVARENMPPTGTDRGMFTIRYLAKSNEPIRVEAIKADEHYIELYGIKLLAGRSAFASDSLRELVINESLSKLLGFSRPEQAIGQKISTWGVSVPIVGVVADFHKYSYHDPIQPLLIAVMGCTDIAFRMDVRGQPAGSARAILARVERQFKAFYPHESWDYGFLDDEIAQMYEREQTMEWLMNIATVVTLFISCIGLFGLTLFTTERRTREIGIRKVLGARVSDILVMLGKDFVVLVGIALAVASAAGWYLMHRWLQDFAYRVPVVGDYCDGWGAGVACGVGESGEEFEGRVKDNFRKLFRPIFLNWRMGKSFYDLDYIIDISEKRLAEYTVLYQKVFERLTNIILIYSALGIFLIPLTQHLVAMDIKGVVFYAVFAVFAVLLSTSLVYFVRLLLPVNIVYLEPPKKYYGSYKTELELLNIGNEETVNDSLRGTYIFELQNAIEVNSRAVRKKNSYFYNALLFALLSVVPYIVCLGFHLVRGGK